MWLVHVLACRAVYIVICMGNVWNAGMTYVLLSCNISWSITYRGCILGMKEFNDVLYYPRTSYMYMHVVVSHLT